jgi:hypothetical protein
MERDREKRVDNWWKSSIKDVKYICTNDMYYSGCLQQCVDTPLVVVYLGLVRDFGHCKEALVYNKIVVLSQFCWKVNLISILVAPCLHPILSLIRSDCAFHLELSVDIVFRNKQVHDCELHMLSFYGSETARDLAKCTPIRIDRIVFLLK